MISSHKRGSSFLTERCENLTAVILRPYMSLPSLQAAYSQPSSTQPIGSAQPSAIRATAEERQ